jgi:hypothetical protein
MIMASGMHAEASEMVLSSLPPELSETEKRVQLFLRFYEHDFTESKRDKIIAWIRGKGDAKL